MRYHVDAGSGERIVEVDGEGVRLDGREVACEVRQSSGTRFHVRLAGRSVTGFAARGSDGWNVELDGRVFRVRVDDDRAHRIRNLAAAALPPRSGFDVRAPMPGLIVQVPVEVGRVVAEGDRLIVMEAMKMENELRSPGSGVVACVHVEVGMTVERDSVLVEIEQEVT